MRRFLLSLGFILGRLIIPAVIAGIVLAVAVEQGMEWLATAALVMLLSVLYPGLLVDLINRLRPIRVGGVEVPEVGARSVEGTAAGRQQALQDAIDERLRELRNETWFLYLPSTEQQLYAEVAALAVRVAALEEEVARLTGR